MTEITPWPLASREQNKYKQVNISYHQSDMFCVETNKWYYDDTCAMWYNVHFGLLMIYEFTALSVIRAVLGILRLPCTFLVVLVTTCFVSHVLYYIPLKESENRFKYKAKCCVSVWQKCLSCKPTVMCLIQT